MEQQDTTILVVDAGVRKRILAATTNNGNSSHYHLRLLPLFVCTLSILCDSYIHIHRLFSICRFHEVAGRYPDKITVVSFTFKERRFATMHAKALRWPDSRFSYIGKDPSPADGFDLEEASKGEMENAAKPFEEDPYGCNSPILRDKRKGRNPFFRTPSYELSCPDMKELLDYCGPELIDETKVPWKSKK